MKKMLMLLIVLVEITGNTILSQKIISLDSLLLSNPLFKKVYSQPQKYKLQIIFSQVIKDSTGKKSFITQSFNLNDSLYFYPASLVKLPSSIFAIELINELKKNGVDKNTRLIIDSSYSCQKKLIWDYSTNDSLASISAFIEKALVVSDNDAYNRLYDFVGPQYMNQRFKEFGMSKSVIRHRFASCDQQENRSTNKILFLGKTGDTLFSKEQDYFKGVYLKPMKNMVVESFPFYSRKKKPKKTSKDFSLRNSMSLSDVHFLLMELVYPESQKFDFLIDDDDRNFLISKLSINPNESSLRSIRTNPLYHDNMTNYLIMGADSSQNKKDCSITNIVGLAYGFASDVAYIHNQSKSIEFFLSATIYSNYGSKIGYDYTGMSLPFLKSLGQSIYEAKRDSKIH
jgi:hypothetical protein